MASGLPRNGPHNLRETLIADHAVHAGAGAYRRLGIELAIDFALMYLVMYR